MPKSTAAEDINWGGAAVDEARIEERIFRERGEQRYSLEVLPIGITFEVDRLRRESGALVGELSVSVAEKSFRGAKAYNGMISVGDLNFSAVRSRTERSNLLKQRSGAEHLDWFGLLEEFCIRTVQAERQGKPAVVLADVDPREEHSEQWEIDGLPILSELPMVLFGDAASGKSYLAMHIAGTLANQDINVLYADWEFSEREHRKRLGRLFQPMPRNVHYVRCDTALSHQIDRLVRLVREHKCKYLICDSIGFAVDGPAEAQESARTYFRALRQMNVGSLNLAHIPKQYDDAREAQIFGSVFFKAGARSAWFLDKATMNPRNEIRFGLHHRKSNMGELLPSRGYRLLFEHERVRIESIDIKSVDELATQLPVLDRLKIVLGSGALTLKQLEEELSLKQGTIRSVIARHKSLFVKMGNKYGIVVEGMDF